MVDRGFGLELESSYGDTTVTKAEFDPNWWNQADDVNFQLNDKPVTKSGSSRMNKRARAGIMKPDGSTAADADLQQLTWYFRGLLDNYVFTEGDTPETGHEQVYIHEFYGGEGKDLQSFRGVAAFDKLIKYLYGLLVDKVTLECSNDSMKVNANWVYKTEAADIIGKNGATFDRPDELDNEYLFIMFYDLSLLLNNKSLGITTKFTCETSNNLNVDNSTGFGARGPQKKAVAQKRDNKLSVETTLTDDNLEDILAAQYGEVGALKPTSCKLLQVPLKLTIAHCENPDISCEILFPKCTVAVEYNVSGIDEIKTTLTLETLGSSTVTLADETTEVETDIYIKLINNQDELVPAE